MIIIKCYTCNGETGVLLEIIFRMFEEITVGSSTSSLFVFSIGNLYSDTVPLPRLRTLCSYPQSPFHIS